MSTFLRLYSQQRLLTFHYILSPFVPQLSLFSHSLSLTHSLYLIAKEMQQKLSHKTVAIDIFMAAERDEQMIIKNHPSKNHKFERKKINNNCVFMCMNVRRIFIETFHLMRTA